MRINRTIGVTVLTAAAWASAHFPQHAAWAQATASAAVTPVRDAPIPDTATGIGPAREATVRSASRLTTGRTAETAESPAASFPAARLQTALARSGFSPGLIDNKPGRKTAVALETFQRARGLPPTGQPDDATRDALEVPEQWTRAYRLSDADLALVTGPIPTNWNERARLPVSGYTDMTDLLAERGWCSIDLLRALNPGRDFDRLSPGDTVTLPDVGARPLPPISRLEIDLEDKLVKGFDASGKLVSLMHCSIARLMEKRPVGTLAVKVVATDPDYTFDPTDWPEVNNVTRRLRISPGPRNPVGLAWIGLDKPGYGLHGTVKPQDIGKTGSHGCFRLTNWDAVRLARAVKIGTPVEVRE